MKNKELERIVDQELASAVVITDMPRSLVAVSYRQAHRAQIDKLQQEVSDLPTVIDEASFKLVDDKRKEVKRKAVEVNKARLAITKNYRDIVDEINKYLGTNANSGLQGELRKLEADCEAMVAPWNEAKRQEEEAEKRKLEELRNKRVELLTGLGASYNPVSGTIGLGEQRTKVDGIELILPEVFDMLAKAIGEEAARAKREQEEAAEKARRDREELERLRAIVNKQEQADAPVGRKHSPLDLGDGPEEDPLEDIGREEPSPGITDKFDEVRASLQWCEHLLLQLHLRDEATEESEKALEYIQQAISILN